MESGVSGVGEKYVIAEDPEPVSMSEWSHNEMSGYFVCASHLWHTYNEESHLGSVYFRKDTAYFVDASENALSDVTMVCTCAIRYTVDSVIRTILTLYPDVTPMFLIQSLGEGLRPGSLYPGPTSDQKMSFFHTRF